MKPISNFTRFLLLFIFLNLTSCSPNLPTFDCYDDYAKLPFDYLENFIKSSIGGVIVSITKNESKITYAKIDDYYLVSDMMFTESQFKNYSDNKSRINPKSASPNLVEKWTNNTIYYTFSKETPAYNIRINKVQKAMKGLEKINPNIKFVKKSSDVRNYIEIIIDNEDAGCSSLVGRLTGPGKQTIRLGKACFTESTIQHELLHSLGFLHEMERPDSDKYITIKWENIKEGHKHNFKPFIGIDNNNGSKFDINSIMMYEPFNFSKAPIPYPILGKPTITLKDGSLYCLDINRSLSSGDKIALNKLYPRL